MDNEGRCDQGKHKHKAGFFSHSSVLHVIGQYCVGILCIYMLLFICSIVANV